MRLGDQIENDLHAALAALAWQLDCGVDDTIAESPINRYDLPETQRSPSQSGTKTSGDVRSPKPSAFTNANVVTPLSDPVADAKLEAASANSLEELRDRIASYEHCDLKKGARNTVFSDGNPRSRVLVLGEAPGREEDIEGRPFVGRAGQLLDRMFASIGLSRQSPDTETSLYITNVMPWRPPGNRDPEPAEIAMMMPFVEKHILLVDPEVIVVMGNTPLLALTGNKGILRARGTWTQGLGKPILPMTHPAYLLRNPIAKREAWADLLALRARLEQGSQRGSR